MTTRSWRCFIAKITSSARLMIEKKIQKVRSDKGTKFKGAFKQFCEANGMETCTTHHFINELQFFVNTISSRVNRMMGFAPKRVTKKQVANLISLRAKLFFETNYKASFQDW